MDDYIIDILNTLAHHSSFFTKVMFLIVDNDLLKGGVVISILWYLWFNEKSKKSFNHEKIITTLYGCIISVIVGLSLANLLPYRARPILNPEFDFTYQIDELSWLNTWSSFPSDHAVLFFSLATGIFLVSKKWGMISYTYVLLIICFPRIYLGFHYPSDILVGAIVGVLITYGIYILKISKTFSKKIMVFSINYPGVFYASFFILSYQIATLFSDSRDLVSAILKYVFLEIIQ